MTNCKELQDQFENISEQAKNLPGLFADYMENPNEEVKEEVRYRLEALNEFETKLQQSIKDLTSEHPHAEEFKGKTSIKNGRVIITNDLDFSGGEDVYIPSIINTVEGSLNLKGLESTDGLRLPDIAEGSIYLQNLESAEELELSDIVEGRLYLNSLRSAEGLELPDVIKGRLDLRSLESADGLKLPDTVEGNLDLSGLGSADGLKLHDGIEGSIYLNGLSEKERKHLKEEYPSLADQITKSTW